MAVVEYTYNGQFVVPIGARKKCLRVAGHIPGQIFVGVYGGCVKTSGANINQESFH